MVRKIYKKIVRFFHGNLSDEEIRLIKKNDEYVRKYSILPDILRIDIETINRCNGICPFCPVNVHEKQRPYAKMTEELFHKIIDELHEMNYSKSIALFDNNEPFLDERIIDFQKYAREKLPDAFFDLWTNGSLLNVEKFREIMPYLDRMVIDNYSDDGKLTKANSAIKEYVDEHPEYRDKVVISMRKQTEILTSRGGSAPNKKETKAIKAKCVLPFQQLNIRPDGKVSLCCNDALGRYTLGDCNNQTIEEVWNSKKYQSIRIAMKEKGRLALELCDRCDTIGGVFGET